MNIISQDNLYDILKMCIFENGVDSIGCYATNNLNFININLVSKYWNYLSCSLIKKIKFDPKKRISVSKLGEILTKYKDVTDLNFEYCRWFTNEHFKCFGNLKYLNILSLDSTGLETLAYMPPNKVKYLFTRGGAIRAGFNKFPDVEFINASSSALSDLYTLKECKNLKTLILSFTYTCNLEPLITYNKNLQKLDISNPIGYLTNDNLTIVSRINGVDLSDADRSSIHSSSAFEKY